MRGPILTLASAVSLALCVATGFLWVRSYFRQDVGFVCGPVVDDAQRVLDFSSERGDATATLTRTEGFSLGTGPRSGWNLYAEELNPNAAAARWFGFSIGRKITYLTYDSTTTQPPKTTTWIISTPIWFLTLLTALLPLFGIRSYQNRVHPAGHCARCGFDLCATPDRCPECGTGVTPDGPAGVDKHT